MIWGYAEAVVTMVAVSIPMLRVLIRDADLPLPLCKSWRRTGGGAALGSTSGTSTTITATQNGHGADQTQGGNVDSRRSNTQGIWRLYTVDVSITDAENGENGSDNV